MKILVVAPQPFFTPRGTPFSVYYRALAMAEQGVEIDLLTYGSGQDVDLPGTRIIRIPRIQFLEPVPIGPSLQKLLLDVCMIVWTVGLLLRYRYPVVHAHEEAVFWCRWLKPIFRFRLIYDMHSSLPQQLLNFKFTHSRLLIRLFKVLEDSSLKASSVVVTVCPDLREQVLAAGIMPDKHLMIENSLFDDVRLRAPQPAAAHDRSIRLVRFGLAHPVIFYAGTFETYQGINLLIEAFARVVRELPMVRLLVVGGTADQVAEAQ
jgi:glycosyltransferase involved in cell wall biosynthesis